MNTNNYVADGATPLEEYPRISSREEAVAVSTTRPEDDEVTGQSLLPSDRGKAAWKLLISAFIFEALFWGFPLSFGVFQNYYSQLPQFANHPYLSVVGTTASGISYLGAPIIIPIIKRFTKYRSGMIWLGWPMCIIGLLAGSFATRLETLILTQGIMYGTGFVIFYYPIISMVNEFWITRRGMAYGLLCSSSGVSGTMMPFAFEAMLNKYGYPTTLRAAAVGLFVLTAPLLFFLKSRTPDSEVSVLPRTDWTFLRVPLFWIYTACNLAQGFGYFFPSIYLPSYATSIGLSSRQGALLLTLMSISQSLGQLSFGFLSDRNVSLNFLIVTATILSSIAVFTCWGLARTYGLLLLFSVTFGYFGAGYGALWARMATAVTGDHTAAFAAFGLFNLCKGIGNVLTGVVGGSLVGEVANKQRYGAMKYEGMVLVTGFCMLFSGSMISFCYLKHLGNARLWLSRIATL